MTEPERAALVERLKVASIRAESWLDRNANAIDGMPHGLALSELSAAIDPLRRIAVEYKALDALSPLPEREAVLWCETCRDAHGSSGPHIGEMMSPDKAELLHEIDRQHRQESRKSDLRDEAAPALREAVRVLDELAATKLAAIKRLAHWEVSDDVQALRTRLACISAQADALASLRAEGEGGER